MCQACCVCTRQAFTTLTWKAAYQDLHNQAMNGGGAAGAAYRKYCYIPAGVGVNDYVNRSIGCRWMTGPCLSSQASWQ